MKTTMKILICAMMLLIATPATYAQKSNKELKKDMNSKVSKDNKKVAKKLTKEGWKVMPGKLPIERQIQDAIYAELDENGNDQKRFFIGTHQAIGGNYSAAKQIADSRARLELAQSVYSAIAQKIEEQIANKNFGDGDIELIDEFVSANKSIISTQLSGVVPVVEIYREKENGQYEVMVTVKIDAASAMKMAKSGLRSELQKKSDKLAADLDKILPY